jgi:copper chaperone
MATTILSVPEIHCEHCRTAIEGAVSPIDGVDEVEVDIDAATVRVEHDDELGLESVVDAIEDQGYDVPDQDALAGVR